MHRQKVRRPSVVGCGVPAHDDNLRPFRSGREVVDRPIEPADGPATGFESGGGMAPELAVRAEDQDSFLLGHLSYSLSAETKMMYSLWY